jgi:hypothetical protein
MSIKGFNFDNGQPSLPIFYHNSCLLVGSVAGIFSKSAGRNQKGSGSEGKATHPQA